jgi:hypothetical protein
MEIKGLRERLNLTDEQTKKFLEMKAQFGMRMLVMMSKVVGSGGNIHRVNKAATAKRRAKNKLARKQRKANRGR